MKSSKTIQFKNFDVQLLYLTIVSFKKMLMAKNRLAFMIKLICILYIQIF